MSFVTTNICSATFVLMFNCDVVVRAAEVVVGGAEGMIFVVSRLVNVPYSVLATELVAMSGFFTGGYILSTTL